MRHFELLKNFLVVLVILTAFISPAKALSPDEASDKLAERLLTASSHQQFMYYLINKKDYETVKLFVEAGKVDLNQTYCGLSPLVYALSYKRPDIALLLLEHGANPKTEKIGGYSALYLAVKYGYTEVVREMLKDPNLNIKRERMFFRLPYVKTAHNKGYTEIEQMLIEHQRKYDLAHPEKGIVVPENNTFKTLPVQKLPENTDAI